MTFMNKLILEAHEFFKNCDFSYYICGGFALEMFVGKTMRKHSDLDVSLFHENKRDVVALLQNDGWNMYKRIPEPGTMGCATPIADHMDSKLDEIRTMWAIKPGSHITLNLREGETDIYDFDILRDNQTDFNFIEIVLDSKKGDNFVLREDINIVRQLDKAILYNNGIPYMSPELVMFLKSPQVYTTHDFHKEKTPADFKTIIPLLPDESRQWLINALNTAYPDGYGWISYFGGEMICTHKI